MSCRRSFARLNYKICLLFLASLEKSTLPPAAGAPVNFRSFLVLHSVARSLLQTLQSEDRFALELDCARQAACSKGVFWNLDYIRACAIKPLATAAVVAFRRVGRVLVAACDARRDLVPPECIAKLLETASELLTMSDAAEVREQFQACFDLAAPSHAPLAGTKEDRLLLARQHVHALVAKPAAESQVPSVATQQTQPFSA